MGHQYAGADTYPSDFTIPDDLDDDKAATFNVAFEALADRTTHLVTRDVAQQVQIDDHQAQINDLIARIPALNFENVGHGEYLYVKYDSFSRSWIGVGGTDLVQGSANGRDWSGGMTAGAYTAITMRVGVNENDGSLVVLGTGTGVAERDAAGVWTHHGSVFGYAAALGENTEVLFDGTRWVTFYTCTGGVVHIQIRSSTDRATWTSHGTGPFVAAGTAKGRLATNKLGRAVFVSVNGATGTSEAAVSLDGGVTFVGGAVVVAITHGFGSAAFASLEWNTEESIFVYVVSELFASKIYTSPDGVTWTLRRSITTVGINGIAFTPGLWLATSYASSLIMSLDAGVTWRPTFVTDGILLGIASDGVGQFLVITNYSNYVSARTRNRYDVVT